MGLSIETEAASVDEWATWKLIFDNLVRNVDGASMHARISSMGARNVSPSVDSHPSQVANPEGILVYAYDDLGRKTSTSVFPANADTTTATPERITNYTYDALGRLASVVEDLDPLSTLDTPLSTSYGYDVLGNMDRTDLPNGVVTDYEYDALNRLDVMTDYARDATPDDLSDNQKLAEYDYEVRADGKRTSAKETFWLDAYNYGTPEPHVNHINWTYDDIGRLTDEVFNHFDDNLDQTEHFVYDLTGNRISKTVDKGNDGSIEEAITYSYDANDRLLEEVLDDLTDDSNDRTTTYGYDHTQQTSKQVSDALNSQLSTLNYVYNLQGRMAEVTTTEASGKVTVTSFEYDATGIRIASTHKIDADGDGTFESQVRTENLVDHNNFTGYQQSIKETHTDLVTGKVIKTIEYTYGHDEIAQTVTEFNPDGTVASEVTHVFGHDGHGSVRVLYDSVASILQVFAYTSYGEMLGIHDGQGSFLSTEEAVALTILLYSGEPYYQQIAMQYLRARFYDPATGRFNRLDPFAGNMQDPQSLHKYLYVHGDPVQGVDPTGQFSVRIAISMGIRGSLMAIGFGAINYGFSRARGVSHEASLQSAKTAALAGFALAVPVVRLVVGLGLLGRFAYDLMRGNYDHLTIPELGAYVLWAIIVNKGAMPPINRGLGVEPAATAPVAIKQNGVEIPETQFPGTIIVGSSNAGNVAQFMGQFSPSQTTGFTAVGEVTTGRFLMAASDVTVLRNNGRPLGLLPRNLLSLT